MTWTIERFGSRCHDILKQSSGPEGLEKVRQGLEQVLVDEDILAEHLGLSVEDVEKRLEEADGSIIAVIDSGREGRHLEPLPIRQLDAADEVMSEQEMLDPIRPFSLRRAIRRRIGL